MQPMEGSPMSEELTLWVAGMCCGNCRDRLTTALKAVKGVERVWVDLARNEAVVWGDPAQGDLAAAVAAAGFTLSPYPVPEPRGVG
jgi:copper chaperone CopZ